MERGDIADETFRQLYDEKAVTVTIEKTGTKQVTLKLIVTTNDQP